MILDIIIVLILALGAFMGYRKGLIGIFVSLVSIILSIILGFVLQTPIANALYEDTGLGSIIEQTVYNNINASNKEEENGNNIYSNIIDSVIGKSQAEYTIEQTSKVVTMFILKGLSFVLVFIVVFIVCYILQMILNLVFSLPLLDSVNKLGGLAAGLVKGLLKLYIVLAIISFMAPISIVEPIVNFINTSFVTKFLYENNLFVSIISGTLKI